MWVYLSDFFTHRFEANHPFLKSSPTSMTILYELFYFILSACDYLSPVCLFYQNEPRKRQGGTWFGGKGLQGA